LAGLKPGFCIELLMFFVSGILRFEFLATASVYSYLCCLLLAHGAWVSCYWFCI